MVHVLEQLRSDLQLNSTGNICLFPNVLQREVISHEVQIHLQTFFFFNYLYNGTVNFRSNIISSEMVCINERSCNNQDFKKWCSLLFTHFHNYLPAPAQCRTLICLSSWVIAGREKWGKFRAFFLSFSWSYSLFISGRKSVCRLCNERLKSGLEFLQRRHLP